MNDSVTEPTAADSFDTCIAEFRKKIRASRALADDTEKFLDSIAEAMEDYEELLVASQTALGVDSTEEIADRVRELLEAEARAKAFDEVLPLVLQDILDRKPDADLRKALEEFLVKFAWRPNPIQEPHRKAGPVEFHHLAVA
jgi:hypothetical protein